jgi:hypothetical protein
MKTDILLRMRGNFGTPTASVSFISKDLSVLENDIYKKNNNENLGDVLQTIIQ